MEKRKIGAGILMIDTDSGKILLARRHSIATEPNTWASFGGIYDEKDGHPKVTAKREFKEETGITVPYKISKTPIYANENNHLIFYTYIGLADNQFNVILDGENSGYGWFELNRLPDNLHPGLEELLENKEVELKKIINKFANIS